MVSRESWIGIAFFGAILCGAQPVVADEQILYAFCSQPACADGQFPYASVIADDAGNLYGTTSVGGDSGLGVVFKLTPDGTETVLHSFKGGSDGAIPYAGLAFDASGNLLGTTSAGGGSTQCGDVGCGTVFKIAPDGTETILHAFCLGKRLCRDGISPFAGVTLDGAGNIYGTTQYGSIDMHLDNGIVFRVTPDGREKIVWSFGGGGDGANPMGGVFLDDKLGILGTASADSGGCGCAGAIYRVRQNGIETLLYKFPLTYERGPQSSLTPDGKGHFYGTTPNGQTPGTVYKLTPPRNVVTLHTFGGNGDDGFEVYAEGVAYYKGNLYGVSVGGGGGPPYEGTIFELTPSGAETILHRFVMSPDGDTPYATPTVFDGDLYGTTAFGGTTGCGGRGCGTVFKYGPLH
jgi:uncharacterized repeat protein (TIGR03803 family)